MDDQLKTKEVELDIKGINQKKVVKKEFNLEESPEPGLVTEKHERDTEVVDVR